MRKLSFALIAILTGVGAANAADVCALVVAMQPVFNTLRTLAFVGAGFCIAGWAWGYISKGEAKLEDIKGKGIGLLVGFTLLFSIGLVLQFLGPISGCAASAFM